MTHASKEEARAVQAAVCFSDPNSLGDHPKFGLGFDGRQGELFNGLPVASLMDQTSTSGGEALGRSQPVWPHGALEGTD